jgi:hypothetical protein
VILTKETFRYGEVTDPTTGRSPVREPAPHRAARRAPRAAAQPGVWAVYMACWLLVLMVSLFMAERQMSMTRIGYRIGDARKELALLQREGQHLGYQVAALDSLARVEGAARSLGLVSPTQRVAVLPAAVTTAVAPTPGTVARAERKPGILSSIARAIGFLLGRAVEAGPTR